MLVLLTKILKYSLALNEPCVCISAFEVHQATELIYSYGLFSLAVSLYPYREFREYHYHPHLLSPHPGTTLFLQICFIVHLE